MAEKLEIEVEIGLDGKVSLKTRGFKGPSCFEETASLEKVLGGKVTRREKSGEYYQKATTSTKVKAR